jgi:AraC-like DNA-binding protein
LVYASRGVLTVTTDHGIWVVPPQRAVWVPAGVSHEVGTAGAASLCTLYIDRSAVAGLPEDCCVVAVSPLLREMILHAVTISDGYDRKSAEGRFIDVLLDQVRGLPVQPLHLPAPSDRRLQSIAHALTTTPADTRSLDTWAKTVGASARTLARLFVAETGMTFGQWRQQARLLEALRLLAAGQPVTTVALDLGYESQSAFIAMFKKALGTTPGRYFAG